MRKSEKRLMQNSIKKYRWKKCCKEEKNYDRRRCWSVFIYISNSIGIRKDERHIWDEKASDNSRMQRKSTFLIDSGKFCLFSISIECRDERCFRRKWQTMNDDADDHGQTYKAIKSRKTLYFIALKNCTKMEWTKNPLVVIGISLELSLSVVFPLVQSVQCRLFVSRAAQFLFSRQSLRFPGLRRLFVFLAFVFSSPIRACIFSALFVFYYLAPVTHFSLFFHHLPPQLKGRVFISMKWAVSSHITLSALSMHCEQKLYRKRKKIGKLISQLVQQHMHRTRTHWLTHTQTRTHTLARKLCFSIKYFGG